MRASYLAGILLFIIKAKINAVKLVNTFSKGIITGLHARVHAPASSFSCSLNRIRTATMLKSNVSFFRKLKLLFVLPGLVLVFSAFRSPEYNHIKASTPEKEAESLASALQKQAGGMVVDEEGNPLKGVRVLVSRSTIFSTTDAKGRFSISRIPDGSSLIFSCPGYKTYTMLPLIISNTGIRVRMVKDPEFKKVPEKLPLPKADTENQVPSPTSI